MAGETLLERFGKSFAKGTVLFREGDAGQEMFVVHSGKVQLTRKSIGRDLLVADLAPGDFFGEMAIINNRPRSATATVVEDASLLVIDGKTFGAMIRDKAEIAVRMIRTLAARLEQTNQQLELLLLPDANHRIVQCLRQLAEQQGTHLEGGAVYIPASVEGVAGRVALKEQQVQEHLGKLRQARLVLTAREAGLEAEGFVVPEPGRLQDFLEFLEMKERLR